jgi:hypothetical protein
VGTATLRANTTGSFNAAHGGGALRANTTGFSNTAAGYNALEFNRPGALNAAFGSGAMVFNDSGTRNAAVGYLALGENRAGNENAALGARALYNTLGSWNVAVGAFAGRDPTIGSYNVYVGANVHGSRLDANTMRLGLPYDSGTGAGQNRTFIAGIHGTQLTGPAVQVFVDANGQLGTLTPPIVTGTVTLPVSVLQQQVQEQQATILELRQGSREQQATIDGLLARLARLEEAGARRR